MSDEVDWRNFHRMGGPPVPPGKNPAQEIGDLYRIGVIDCQIRRGCVPAKSDKDNAYGRLAVPFILIFSLCALDSIRFILHIFVTGSYM